VIDYLPGFNATFLLNSKTNLRFSGSQTVVRPEFRELTNLNYYDFDLNAAIQGNPKLQRTKITNADIRYEVYPRAGELFTAGVFYKYFKAPIEQVFNLATGGASTFNFQNPEKAQAFGAEVEFRKKLDFNEALKNFTFQSNVSYIKSRVRDEKLNNLDRPLQGQSNFLVNAALMYDAPIPALNFTLLYNQVGKRIAFVGGEDYPDIWESSRPVVDLQVAKKILKSKGELKLNISDLLNKSLYFYQNIDGNTNFNKGVDAYRFTRKFGTSINATFGYSF
jgi:outer membrane receptor protein involved in Fe transport